MRSNTLYKLMVLTVIASLVFIGCSDDDNTDNPAGTDGPTPLAAIGSWQTTSVTVNGASQSLADFYDWDSSTVRSVVVIGSDSIITTYEYDAQDSVLYWDRGTATFIGDSLTVTMDSQNGQAITPELAFAGTWSVAGSAMTMIMVDNTDTVVMVNTKL